MRVRGHHGHESGGVYVNKVGQHLLHIVHCPMQLEARQGADMAMIMVNNRFCTLRFTFICPMLLSARQGAGMLCEQVHFFARRCVTRVRGQAWHKVLVGLV